MIPILYEESEQNFTTLGLGALNDAVFCEVHTVLNGAFELEMRYPVSGKRYSDIRVSRIIKAVAEKNGKTQLFDIYEITKPISGIITIYASHVSERRQYIPIMPFSNAPSATSAFYMINANAAESNPFTFWTDIVTPNAFSLKTPASLGNVLGGMEGSMLDVYRGEYEFDNFNVKFHRRRGQDNGVTLRYGKNITNIEQEESIASTITGICPFWADLEGENVVTLPEKVIESPKAANFPFKRTVVKDFSTSFEEQPTEGQLRMKAQSYINTSGIGTPNIGMDISYEHLSDYEGYQDVALLEQVKLGDTVNVYFEPLEITATARVVETYYNPLLDKYRRIRIGSVKSTLATVINENAEIAKQDVADLVTGTSNALNRAVDLLSGAEGGNIVINRNALTGQPYEILIMDTDDVSTALNVLRLNMNGLGLSTNGINGPYTAAITGEGIIATAIKTGVLSDLNGKFSLDMSSGTVNMANANITGGTVNIETDSENDDRIRLRYESEVVGNEKNIHEFYISPAFAYSDKEHYVNNALSYTDNVRVGADGISYSRFIGSVSFHVDIDNSGIHIYQGTKQISLSLADNGIIVRNSTGAYSLLTASAISFYDRNGNLIKSL